MNTHNQCFFGRNQKKLYMDTPSYLELCCFSLWYTKVCVFVYSAGPISRALDLGADIVVTGRCVDSALVLAPLLHTVSMKKWHAV